MRMHPFNPTSITLPLNIPLLPEMNKYPKTRINWSENIELNVAFKNINYQFWYLPTKIWYSIAVKMKNNLRTTRCFWRWYRASGVSGMTPWLFWYITINKVRAVLWPTGVECRRRDLYLLILKIRWDKNDNDIVEGESNNGRASTRWGYTPGLVNLVCNFLCSIYLRWCFYYFWISTKLKSVPLSRPRPIYGFLGIFNTIYLPSKCE